jgi:hypothetical protein
LNFAFFLQRAVRALPSTQTTANVGKCSRIFMQKRYANMSFTHVFRHFRCGPREAENYSDKFGHSNCVFLRELVKSTKCPFPL